VALDTYWTIVALVVGATAALVVAATRRQPRTVSGRLLAAGIVVSGLGWLIAAACALAGPPELSGATTRAGPAVPGRPGSAGDHSVIAVTVVAATAVVLSASLLLAAVEKLPGAGNSVGPRLRRAVDGLQVTSALLLSGWIIATLILTDDDRIVVHASPTWIASAVSVIGLAAAVSFAIVEVRHTPRPRGMVAVLVTGIVAVAAGNAGIAAAIVVRPTVTSMTIAGSLAVAGFVAIGAASTAGRRLVGPAAEQLPIRWGLPVVTVGAALVTTVVHLSSGGHPDVVSAVLGVLTGFTLMVRQALALTDARRYLGRLRDDEQHLRELAYTDPLTGVGNRRHLMAALTDGCVRDQDFVLVALDLDGFTAINDLRGHIAGDEVLAAVGERLRASLRPGDIAARTGGDEFAVLLTGADSDADSVAERLLRTVSEPYKTSAGSVFVTASAGHAAAATADDAKTLLRNADAALRLAKRHGTGTIQRYDATHDDFAHRRTAIEQGLRGALAAGEFTLAYQPIVTLPDARPIAVEALLRWDSARLGRVPPDEFIPIAEEVGLIASIDRWVMHEACRQLGRWLDDGHDLWLSVNVSIRELHQPEYVDQVGETLRIHHVRADRLVIEVTEHSAALDLDSVVGRLSELRATGVRIALDDFGAGYSSLGQLRQLPVDILKIDRSLVGDPSGGPPGDSESRAVAPLVDVVVQLGERLGLQVIAEGVGDPAQRQLVEASGCRLGQGDLFGPAAPAERIEAMLAAEVSFLGGSSASPDDLLLEARLALDGRQPEAMISELGTPLDATRPIPPARPILPAKPIPPDRPIPPQRRQQRPSP
jgi:diguanylate cyclase (GGDEF)-like protein